MTRAIFIFISGLLLLSPLVFYAGEVSVSTQLLYCTPFLLFLGIPHGALDNILVANKKGLNNFHFICIYLVLIGVNIFLWIIIPRVAYILFLLMSAYHFGQSQFTHYFDQQPLSHKILFLSWGISLLSGLIYLNIEEISLIISNYTDFEVFEALHQAYPMFWLFVTSTSLTIAQMITFVAFQKLRMESLFMEALVLLLIFSCFYLMPLLVGFTLYFVILHSFKVLLEEFKFLKTKKEVQSTGSFIRMIAPFTLLSIAGICLLFGLIYIDILKMNYGYTLMIVISAITFPHVFVMNWFYDFLFRSNFSKS